MHKMYSSTNKKAASRKQPKKIDVLRLMTVILQRRDIAGNRLIRITTRIGIARIVLKRQRKKFRIGVAIFTRRGTFSPHPARIPTITPSMIITSIMPVMMNSAGAKNIGLVLIILSREMKLSVILKQATNEKSQWYAETDLITKYMICMASMIFMMMYVILLILKLRSSSFDKLIMRLQIDTRHPFDSYFYIILNYHLISFKHQHWHFSRWLILVTQSFQSLNHFNNPSLFRFVISKQYYNRIIRTQQMYSKTPRQYRLETAQIDWTLEKSKYMFDPSLQPSAYRTLNFQTDQNNFHSLKKPPLPSQERLHQSNIAPPFHSNNYLSSSYGPSSSLAQYVNDQVKPQSQHLIYNSTVSKGINSVESGQVGGGVMKTLNKFEKHINLQVKGNKAVITQDIDHQMLINQIIDQFKKRHVPNILKSIKKQLSDEIHHLRMEMQTLREELRSETVKQWAINHQIKNQITTLNNNQNNTVSNIKQQLNKEYTVGFTQSKTSMQLLQDKYNQIEVFMKESFNKYAQQFKRISTAIDQSNRKNRYEKFSKTDSIKPCLPPSEIEYKQSLTVKKSDNEVNKQIVVFSCEYNIDRLGYLLDSHNCYLLDEKGNQIQLDEKHFRILQQHHIIHP